MGGGRQREPGEQWREERHKGRKQVSELANSSNTRAGKLLPTDAAVQPSGEMQEGGKMRAGVSEKSQASPVPASPSGGQGDVALGGPGLGAETTGAAAATNSPFLGVLGA